MELPVVLGVATSGALLAGWLILQLLFFAGHPWVVAHLSANQISWMLFITLGMCLPFTALLMFLVISDVFPIVWCGMLICCSNWIFSFTRLFPSINNPKPSSSYASSSSPSRIGIFKILFWLALGFALLAMLSAAVSANDKMVVEMPSAPLTRACNTTNNTNVCTDCFNFTKLSNSFCSLPTDSTYLRTVREGIPETKEESLALLVRVDRAIVSALPVLAAYARVNVTNLKGCYSNLLKSLCEFYFPICGHSCAQQIQCAETCETRYATCRDVDFALGELTQNSQNSFFSAVVPDEVQRNRIYDFMKATPLCRHECKYISLNSSTQEKASCLSPDFYDYTSGNCSIDAQRTYQASQNKFEQEKKQNQKFPIVTTIFSSFWLLTMCCLLIYLVLYARNFEKEFDICHRDEETLFRVEKKTGSYRLLCIVVFCFCICFAVGSTLILFASQIERSIVDEPNASSAVLVIVLLVICGTICVSLGASDIMGWKRSPNHGRRETVQNVELEETQALQSTTEPTKCSLLRQVWSHISTFRTRASMRGVWFRYRIILMELVEVTIQLVALQIQITNVQTQTVLFVVGLISLNLVCFGVVQYAFNPVCAVVIDVIFDSLYFTVSLATRSVETSSSFIVALALAVPACLLAHATHHPSLEFRQKFANKEIVLVHKRSSMRGRTETQDQQVPVFSCSKIITIRKRELIVMIVCTTLGAVLFGTTVSRIQTANENCRARVGELWDQIPSPMLFEKNGFYGYLDCGFDSVTSLQVDDRISSLPSSAFSTTGFSSLTSLDLSNAPGINKLPETVLQHPLIKTITLAQDTKITLNISRIIIPKSLDAIASSVQHINASFSSPSVIQSLLKALSNTDFPSLQTLDFSHSNITDLPPFLERAARLTFFDCSYNSLKDISGVSAWWNAGQNRTLAAKGNPLEKIDWSSLYEVPNSFFEQFVFPDSPLRSVSLTFGGFTEIPEIIFDLNLDTLIVRAGALSNLSSSVSKLTNLTRLDLSYSRLTSLPSTLSELKNLKNLEVGWNSFPEAFPLQLLELPWIQNLSCKQVSISALSAHSYPVSFSEFSELTRLVLAKTDFIDIPDTVVCLVCDQCNGFVPDFHSLPKVQRFLADGWLQFNMSFFPSLQILVLKNCSDLVLEEGSLPELLFLELDSNATVLPSVLPSLRSVRFSGAAIGDIPTNFWNAETTLQALSVSSGVTTIPSVRNLNNLNHFHTTQNVTAELVSEVLNLPNILFVHLPSANFSLLPSNVSSSLCVLVIDRGSHPALSYGHLSCSVAECNNDDSRCYKNSNHSNALICSSCSESCFKRLDTLKTVELGLVENDYISFFGPMPSLLRKSAFEQLCGFAYTC